jgi:hypothetical protein
MKTIRPVYLSWAATQMIVHGCSKEDRLLLLVAIRPRHAPTLAGCLGSLMLEWNTDRELTLSLLVNDYTILIQPHLKLVNVIVEVLLGSLHRNRLIVHALCPALVIRPRSVEALGCMCDQVFLDIC